MFNLPLLHVTGCQDMENFNFCSEKDICHLPEGRVACPKTCNACGRLPLYLLYLPVHRSSMLKTFLEQWKFVYS